MSSLPPLNAAFLPLAVTLVLLCLKALFLGTATAAARCKHKRFINAEDAVWLGGEAVGVDADPGARIGPAIATILKICCSSLFWQAFFWHWADQRAQPGSIARLSCLPVSDTRWPIWLHVPPCGAIATCSASSSSLPLRCIAS